MVIWEVLPSIRAAIAEELVKRELPQKEISRLLGITPPAVSQYVSKKRGYNIVFGEDIRASISQLADDLVDEKISNPWNESVRYAECFEKMRRYADQATIMRVNQFRVKNYRRRNKILVAFSDEVNSSLLANSRKRIGSSYLR